MRFIHTADWQIGKSFRRFGDRETLLRQARLDAIEKIGAAARANGAPFVLVAGDLFDHFAPADRVAREPCERMALFADVTWFIIPGNHDPHRPDGVWDRLRRLGLPPNVRPLLEPVPVDMAPGVTLLPAPLVRKSEASDLTDWWRQAPTPPGAIRIGLAHGSVTGFGGEQEASNPIDPARPASAGLAYMALGDWHRTLRIGERVWYAGTPEPDRFGSQTEGKALLVEVDGPEAPPRVTEIGAGSYRWAQRDARVEAANDLDDLERGLRAMPDTLRTLLRLDVAGAAPLGLRAQMDARLDALCAAFFHLDYDLASLSVRPTSEDLDAIDFDGVLRQSAERLRARADNPALSADERRTAEDALVELFLVVMRTRENAA